MDERLIAPIAFLILTTVLGPLIGSHLEKRLKDEEEK